MSGGGDLAIDAEARSLTRLLDRRERNRDAQRVLRFGFSAGDLDGDLCIHRDVLSDTFREQVTQMRAEPAAAG